MSRLQRPCVPVAALVRLTPQGAALLAQAIAEYLPVVRRDAWGRAALEELSDLPAAGRDGGWSARVHRTEASELMAFEPGKVHYGDELFKLSDRPEYREVTTAELLQAFTLDPARALDSGKPRGIRSRIGQAASGSRDAAAVLDEMISTPSRKPVAVYEVPWRTVRPSDRSARRPLGPSDILWLTRLPQDPAKVTDDDAKVLAKLVLDAEPRSSDERLLRSIFEPGRSWHEEIAVRSQLAAARAEAARLPPLPGKAVEALGAAIQRAVPELTTGAARERARRAVSDAVERRNRERAAGLAQAERALQVVLGGGSVTVPPPPLDVNRVRAEPFSTEDLAGQGFKVVQ